MERAITASDANQRFSELLRDVQDGNSFVVTSRGRPVARVVPIDALDGQASEIASLLTFVTELPRRSYDDWRREELYD